MKKICAVIMSFCLSFGLCGCYDNREIDMTAYVIALGIDKGSEGYNYTFQVSSPLAMGGGGEVGNMGDKEENTRVENIIIGSNDLYEARNQLNNFLSKRINLSHLKMIAISMEAAEEGLEPHMTFLLREREVRPNTRMCVSEGSAEALLKGVNPALEANTAEYYDLVFENGAVFAPPKTLWEFVNETATFSTVLPVGKVADYKESKEFSGKEVPLRVSTSKSEFSGLCLFRDYKAVGSLTPDMSRIFGLLTKETEEAEISLLKDGEYHTVRLFPNRKAMVRVSLSDEEITVNMTMNFTAEINSLGEGISEEEIEDYLEREVYALFKEAQKSGCDIFKAGNCLKRRCRTASEWESLKWKERFEKAYFSPEITVTCQKTDLGTA